jgi:hypothetical protein
MVDIVPVTGALAGAGAAGVAVALVDVCARAGIEQVGIRMRVQAANK